MCSGKTTLGKEVARRLGVDFFDLDELIERRSAKSVSRFFADHGEAAFRRMEQQVLDELLSYLDGKGGVVALGGGTPCAEGVMQKLNECGTTVYLSTPVSRIVERILLEPDNRPLVKGKTPTELSRYVALKLDERHPFYSAARLIIDSSRLETVDEVRRTAENLLQML